MPPPDNPATSSSKEPTVDKMIVTLPPESIPVPEKPPAISATKPTTEAKSTKVEQPSKPNPAPPKKPSIKYTITNLLQTNSPSTDAKFPHSTPAPPEPKPVGTYFNNIKLKSKLETNKGSFHTIDVQSDMRFITYYLHYTTIKSFPELVIDNNPYVSPASLTGYKLILFNAHQLILDSKCHHSKSHYTAFFEDSSKLSSFVNTLMNCKIPNDLAIELQQLAPVMDPLRPDMEFVPSLACFDMSIDFSRTFPGYIYFQMHNLLADVSNFTTAKDIIDEIYQIIISNITNVPLTISNLFGGPFSEENRIHTHNNWIRHSLEETLMPLFGYCLSERPTLIELPIQPARFPNLEHVNPYIYTLLGTVVNQPNIEKFVQSINRFYSEKDPSLPTLGSFFNKVSGMFPLTHSIEGPTLPTWHSLSPTRPSTTKPKLLTYIQFAKLSKFCDSRPTYVGNLKVPDESLISKQLYQVEKKSLVQPNAQFSTKYTLNPTTFTKTFCVFNPTQGEPE